MFEQFAWSSGHPIAARAAFLLHAVRLHGRFIRHGHVRPPGRPVALLGWLSPRPFYVVGLQPKFGLVRRTLNPEMGCVNPQMGFRKKKMAANYGGLFH
jgi:hypothetical protein